MTDTQGRADYRTHQLAMAALAATAFFASAPGQSFLIAVFVDDMLVGTGLSRTTFSGLYAAGTVVSAGSMLVLGRIVDRHGLRAAWAVVSLALALACGLASLAAGALLAFLALVTLRTFGQGSLPLLGTLLVARNFEGRRGQAMAVANLGITGASVLLPPVVATLIVAVGWRHSYQVLGLALLLIVLPLAVFVKDGPPRPAAAPDPAAKPATYPPATRRVRHGRFTIPTLSAGLMLLVLAGPPLVGTALTFHAVSILGEKQLSFLQAGFALSILGAASAAGTVVSGLLADRLSNRALLTMLSATVMVAPLALLVPHPAAAYAAYGVLGFTMGGMGVINGTVWARTYGVAQLGRIQGTAQSSMITAAALAPLVPAISQSLLGSYTGALVVFVIFSVLTTVVAARWRVASD
ncbi:MAG: MFS transporter [Propionibacteriales bacterium]|nr:MFS transporter [Propionibacteriales bacterium]